jgi:signal peptidase I
MKHFAKAFFLCLSLVIFTACSLTKSDIEEINYRLEERYQVVGAAMLPLLLEGEIAVVDEQAYEQNPVQRGDVIVFKHIRNPEIILLKRVIGLPGEEIQIAAGSISINASEIEEEYVEEPASYSGRWQLGENEYFVLGDNRNNSSDSHSWGALPAANIIGKAVEVCETDSAETCEAIPSITYNLEN